MNNQWLTIRKHLSFAALAVALTALLFSTKICHLGVILFLILWITEGDFYSKLKIIRQSILLQVLIIFCSLELISLLYTENMDQGWFSIEKKIFLFALPIALATTSVKFEKKEIQWLFYLFVASCFAGTLLCLYNSIQQMVLLREGSASLISYLPSALFNKLNPSASNEWFLFSYVALADGIHIHPTYFSVYIALCILLLLFKVYETDGISVALKIIHWSLIAYFLIFTVFLSSRIVTASLFFLLILIIVYFMRHQRYRSISFAVLIFIAIAWAQLVYFNPVSRYRNLQEIPVTSLTIQPNHTYNNSTQIRASLWWLAIKSYASVNPIWGTGTGDVENCMRKASADSNVKNIIDSFDPHSQYLHILISKGALGLFIFLCFIGLSAYIAFLNRDYLHLSFLFIFASLCITETALELQKGIMCFTLFWSLLSFQRKSYQTISINLTPSIRARS